MYFTALEVAALLHAVNLTFCPTNRHSACCGTDHGGFSASGLSRKIGKKV
jgi:hypothetical protein